MAGMTHAYNTTGTAGFPECQLHSGKAQLHSGKPSPSATLGEDPPANPHPAKVSFLSAKNCALGEGFAECRAGTRERFDVVGRRPTPFSFFYFLPRVQHSGKIFEFFLIIFAECRSSGTRQRNLFFLKKIPLSRVPQYRHSGKPPLKFFFFVFCFSM